jgi:hypothetical protein
MARVSPDLELALKLESMAISLLKLTHEFEKKSRLRQGSDRECDACGNPELQNKEALEVGVLL